MSIAALLGIPNSKVTAYNTGVVQYPTSYTTSILTQYNQPTAVVTAHTTAAWVDDGKGGGYTTYWQTAYATSWSTSWSGATSWSTSHTTGSPGTPTEHTTFF